LSGSPAPGGNRFFLTLSYTYLMREAIKRHSQRRAAACNPRPSEAIRVHPSPSEAIRGHPSPSEAIRGHPRPSEAIRAHHAPLRLAPLYVAPRALHTSEAHVIGRGVLRVAHARARADLMIPLTRRRVEVRAAAQHALS
jgi:hypothetical protein